MVKETKETKVIFVKEHFNNWYAKKFFRKEETEHKHVYTGWVISFDPNNGYPSLPIYLENEELGILDWPMLNVGNGKEKLPSTYMFVMEAHYATTHVFFTKSITQAYNNHNIIKEIREVQSRLTVVQKQYKALNAYHTYVQTRLAKFQGNDSDKVKYWLKGFKGHLEGGDWATRSIVKFVNEGVLYRKAKLKKQIAELKQERQSVINKKVKF